MNILIRHEFAFNTPTQCKLFQVGIDADFVPRVGELFLISEIHMSVIVDKVLTFYKKSTFELIKEILFPYGYNTLWEVKQIDWQYSTPLGKYIPVVYICNEQAEEKYSDFYTSLIL